MDQGRQTNIAGLCQQHRTDADRQIFDSGGALVKMRELAREAGPGIHIAELGRIAKTLFLLAYVDDEAYRRRILVQLNRGEGRHRLARAVFHGQRGELRQRYREGQEDQLGVLGLVVNAIVLWNTRYIERALKQLEQIGLAVRPEDVERIWPLGFQHINMLGRYSFDLPEQLTRGELRSLRDPSEATDQEVLVA